MIEVLIAVSLKSECPLCLNDEAYRDQDRATEDELDELSHPSQHLALMARRT